MKENQVRKLRKKLGLTQREFAEKTNIPLPTLKSLEAGRFALSETNAQKIANGTGISLSPKAKAKFDLAKLEMFDDLLAAVKWFRKTTHRSDCICANCERFSLVINRCIGGAK